jgi:butyrate kinase
MAKKERMLVINPGSTSTKIAVYDDETPLFVRTVNHPKEDLARFAELFDQFDYRKDLVVKTMEDNGVTPKSLTAVVSRGGLLPPVPAGAFEVNDDICWQLRYKPQNEHPSNMGAAIAKSIADELGIKAYIYDPVTVDEMSDLAKVAALPAMRRKALDPPLNTRAIGHLYAARKGVPFASLTMVIAHMGGGFSISVCDRDRLIDVITDEEGPFSPERTGGLPLFQTLEWATTAGKDYKALMKVVKSNGGMVAHLGTNDAREVERRIAEGDAHARLIYEAMAYGVAKSIGALATVVRGKVDVIILTGGVANSRLLTGWIAERVSFIAPVEVIPGENEMEALAFGVLRVLRGGEKAHGFVSADRPR